ncbi:acetyltransferase [Staphylococcus cohnii]|uniref:acetyltransferase n=1 Tax=Staphylococcus cohnii TaxID=29382 RepID=UPI00374FC875
MKKIFLIGMGGHAKVVKDIIELNNEFEVIGYLDDKFHEKSISDGIIYDNLNSYRNYKDNYFIITIGNNKIRKQIFEKLELPLCKYPKFIHPSAVIGSNVEIGYGTVVMANVVVNADTYVGNHCILNTMASIGHDVLIKDFVHISPNSTLTGGVQVGMYTQIGAGSTVTPKVIIGDSTLVGAGSTVISNILNNMTVFGTPAKPKE